MRHDTRKEILDTAKSLFNEHGYNNISTRDIAGALGISKGNLTYYFKKKEEIIEAIIAENPHTRMTEAPRTLTELNIFFEDIQKTVQENAFYFWHHAQLAQISPTIKKMQMDTFKDNMTILTQSLHSLQSSDILREERYQGEYSRLVNTLLLASIYWTPFCTLKDTQADKFVEQAWSIVYPFLTNTGVENLAKICSMVDRR